MDNADLRGDVHLDMTKWPIVSHICSVWYVKKGCPKFGTEIRRNIDDIDIRNKVGENFKCTFLEIRFPNTVLMITQKTIQFNTYFQFFMTIWYTIAQILTGAFFIWFIVYFLLHTKTIFHFRKLNVSCLAAIS